MTQTLLTLIWRVGRTRPKRSNQRRMACFVVALTTEPVGAGHAMVDMRRDCFQRFIPAMVVDVVEGLSDSIFDNAAVNHLWFSCVRVQLARCALCRHLHPLAQALVERRRRHEASEQTDRRGVTTRRVSQRGFAAVAAVTTVSATTSGGSAFATSVRNTASAFARPARSVRSAGRLPARCSRTWCGCSRFDENDPDPRAPDLVVQRLRVAFHRVLAR